MGKRITAVVTLVALLVTPVLMAADMPTVTPISCASPAAAEKVVSHVPANTASAKVYFKAEGQKIEYYVSMRRAADQSMWAFMPAPELTTKSFTYRVVSTDKNGVQVSSPLLTEMTSLSCPAQIRTSEEERVASNMVIGMTAPGQSVVPPGFLCRGIVSYIAVNGEMRPNYECRSLAAMNTPATGAGATGAGGAATSGTATAATVAEGGLSTRTIVAITAGALAAGSIIYSHNHGHHQQPVSPSRPR